MALQKQPIEINFAGGLDNKTDPYQIPIGKFSRLQNSVFDKYKRMTKRNGYNKITELPEIAKYLTTFEGNLTAVGESLQAFAAGANNWVNKGNINPVSLDVLSLIRSNTNQTQVDTAVSSNNFVCTVYTDEGSGSTVYKYAVADSVTGQNILPPAPIPTSGTVTTAPKVFLLGAYFVIVFGASSNNLRYVKISTVNPVAPTTSVTISTQFDEDTRGNFDGYVSGGILYLAWSGTDGGGAIRATHIDSVLVQHSVTVFAGHSADLMSLTVDDTSSNVFVTFWDDSDNNGWTLVLSPTLQLITTFTQILNNVVITNITATAHDNLETVYFELPTNYAYDTGIPSHRIKSLTCSSTGTVVQTDGFARSVGLASKAFRLNGRIYVVGIYISPNQPTYFLFNDNGEVVSRFAYSNAAADYYTTGLTDVQVTGETVSMGYLFRDLIEPLNKTQGLVAPNGVYSQTGINLMTFTFGITSKSVEIGETLNLTGGFLWSYDGYSPVENNFFLWPDSVEVTTATSGGDIEDQTNFYVALYEWTDNQGNINRSAPSIPVSIVTTGGDASVNTIYVPTLRLTYKISNPVKIVIYRWSTLQQVYYQVTSVTTPLFNDLSANYVTFTDDQANADILGNSILYTTGGVIENIGAPSFNALTLFDNRLWGISAEDPNQLWYSKQVIEATPVEMSDLFTLFIAPTVGVQGSTGKSKCLFPMDDKLIIFKKDASYYINGAGPDNTGANSQYSQPTFITSTVGCENQESIVLIPMGLVFQSDKGIWLLGRDLSSKYIGAPVEDFTQNSTVLSAVSVPGTNQVRFTMDSGVTLMYDYFFDQWGTFVNIPSNSATIYQDLHTFINDDGLVYQESIGRYLDGSKPVLQSFTTSWIAAAGLIGLQRVYHLNLLGTYYSPHLLNMQVAYDYDTNPIQNTVITPINFGGTWGNDVPVGNPGIWGGSGTWGAATNVEKERLFFDRQKCTSFQLSVDEIYDPSLGMAAGAGLSLSGLNLTVGIKKTYSTPSASESFG